MRLWSIHPKYLDSKGLVALWREGLLAKKVLEGNTKGYIKHPQLVRFKSLEHPILGINNYLYYIFKEAKSRNFNFDLTKLRFEKEENQVILVTFGQIEYEFNHLLIKLKKRDSKKHDLIKVDKNIVLHPMFKMIEGEIEKWEKNKE